MINKKFLQWAMKQNILNSTIAITALVAIITVVLGVIYTDLKLIKK